MLRHIRLALSAPLASAQPRAMVRPATSRPCATAHQPQLSNRKSNRQLTIGNKKVKDYKQSRTVKKICEISVICGGYFFKEFFFTLLSAFFTDFFFGNPYFMDGSARISIDFEYVALLGINASTGIPSIELKGCISFK